MLDHALNYARRGWRVFPIRTASKVPLPPNGRNAATTSESQICAWWQKWPSANIGMLTGAGIAVVDIDNEDGFEELETAHEFPETLEAVTGRGRHMFFRYDAGDLRTKIGFGRGVDIIAERGCVVLPPSVHESGAVYTWDTPDEGPTESLAELPAWIAAAVQHRPRDVQAGAAEVADNTTRYGAAALSSAADIVDKAATGTRNATLYAEACSIGRLIAGGEIVEAEARDVLLEAALGAGLDEVESLRAIAGAFKAGAEEPRNGTRQPAQGEAGHELPGRAAAEEQPQPPLFQVGDEQEVANYVLRIIERDGPTVGDLGALWQYATGEGVWRAIEDDKGRNMVGALWGAQVVRNVDDEGEIETKHWRIGKNTRRNVWDIACEERQTAGFFNDAPAALVFDDCAVTVDASGGVTAHEHSSSFRARVGYPFKFARTACARWLAALAQWFDGDDDGAQKAQLIQEFTGACLFGLAPRYQRAVILFGRGGNGKSTCLDALEAMFPRDAVSHVAPQAMMGNSAEYYLAELRDSRINVVRDMPSTALLQSADFKAAVSGEPLMGRPIGSDPFAFNPKAGHIFGANALPATTDQSTGFWRRWVVVPFFRRFEVARGSEDLARAIVRDELPGMVAWAVEGAANLTARGHYVLPDSHRDAVDAWASNVNPVKAWLEDTCASGAEKWTRFGTLYQNHRDWCQANGVHPVASRKFGERLEALGVERATRKGVKGFRVAALAVN